jgi:hypothetical protein
MSWAHPASDRLLQLRELTMGARSHPCPARVGLPTNLRAPRDDTHGPVVPAHTLGGAGGPPARDLLVWRRLLPQRPVAHVGHQGRWPPLVPALIDPLTIKATQGPRRLPEKQTAMERYGDGRTRWIRVSGAWARSPGVHPRSDPRPLSGDRQRGGWLAVRIKPDLPTISWLE